MNKKYFEALLIRDRWYDKVQNTSRDRLRSKSRSISNCKKCWHYGKTCHIKKYHKDRGSIDQRSNFEGSQKKKNT